MMVDLAGFAAIAVGVGNRRYIDVGESHDLPASCSPTRGSLFSLSDLDAPSKSKCSQEAQTNQMLTDEEATIIEWYEERAAIREFDGYQSRETSERESRRETAESFGIGAEKILELAHFMNWKSL